MTKFPDSGQILFGGLLLAMVVAPVAMVLLAGNPKPVNKPQTLEAAYPDEHLGI